jgi:DNA segregation ATPase FtsK/SpoIIIE, S-DNA-T family
MRTVRRSRSMIDRLPDPVRAFLIRRAAEMAGFVLLALVVFIVASLISWSADDPSLSNAIGGQTRNWMGRPGAMFADLAMQLTGVATLAVLLPLFFWSINLIASRPVRGAALRMVFWVAGFCAVAATASALPVTARWPMPTGLGGVLGDALYLGTRNLIGLSGSPFGGIVGFIYAGIGILAMIAAIGAAFPESKPQPDMTANPQEDEDELYHHGGPSKDEPGFAVIAVGALAHGFMSLKSALARRFSPSSQMAHEGSGYGERVDSRADAYQRAVSVDRDRPVTARREPRFEGNHQTQDDGVAVRPPSSRTAALQQEQDRQDQDRHDRDIADQVRRDEEELASRVAERTPALKPGKRLQRETQPSLLDRDTFQLPALQLLAEPKRSVVQTVSADSLEQNATLLEGVLEDFGVRGEITNVRPGPVVTLYELEPAPGTKSSRVISLADDIARSMSAVSARVAVVQGRNVIGIELPNAKRETVFLRELLASADFETSKSKLALCLGKTIGGEPVIADLAKMPHLLVAGTTGSGKSVAINTMILSLLYRLRPEECRLIMVDPKMLELSVYDGIPHLLTPVVTDPKKAVVALKWAVREMEERYRKMSKVGVRNIEGFNVRVGEAKVRGEIITRDVQTGFDRHTGAPIYEQEVMELEPLPFIVVIVDEMADLMMVAGKEIEGTIQRLAQMARAAGIHVVLATQRPSVDVITGTIKANFPTRISFQVTSKIDSRTILGEMGAEQLLGQGDMLYMAGGGRITRVHGPFVSDSEVEQVVAHLKMQGRPQYLDAVTTDEAEAAAASAGEEESAVFDKGSFGEPSGDLYEQAVAVVLRDKKASTSYIQRRLQIGYNRAASLMERMETEGIVGAANHAGKREILVEAEPHNDSF